MPKRVAIIGGGITGLAAAYRLERLCDAEIDLYEASDRLGGKLQTRRDQGYLIEAGPDCFFSRKPGMMQLIAELGLDTEVIEPQQKEFFMLVKGHLHRVPGGLVTFTYSCPDTLERATFLSPEGKRRALQEADQAAGTGDDESIRSFFTRRFGSEFASLVAEPLLAGTHGGDASLLSMRALYPGYFGLERKHGSLAAGMQQTSPSGSGQPSFLSFKEGMGSLVQALTRQLTRTRIHLNRQVSDLAEINADEVLIALPANQAADLLAGQEASELVRSIEHRSSAIVTFGFRKANIEHPLDGTGFLAPPASGAGITGSTWSSRKWAGRAPEGHVLVRVFLGGERERLEQVSEEVLVAEALAGITDLLGIKGPPVLCQATRWIRALPQYKVGHLELVSRLGVTLRKTNLTLAGTSFHGVGVPDSLRQGQEAAEQIATKL